MRAFGCGVAALLLLAAPGVPQEGGFRVPVTLGPPAEVTTTYVSAADAGPRPRDVPGSTQEGIIRVPGGFFTAAEFVMGDPRRQPPSATVLSAGAGTTDVVVTDADGRVLECWRGDFRPGEVVRLGPARLSLADALPWEFLRLRSDRSLSKFYHATDVRHEWQQSRLATFYQDNRWNWGWRGWDPPPPPMPVWFWPTAENGAETELRLVLFLRKEAVAGLPTIWIPATAPEPGKFTTRFYNDADNGRSPQSDFVRCVTVIEGGRVVTPCPDEVAAATLAEFKTRAILRTQPMPGEYRFDTGIRRYANFGPLSAVPALTAP